MSERRGGRGRWRAVQVGQSEQHSRQYGNTATYLHRLPPPCSRSPPPSAHNSPSRSDRPCRRSPAAAPSGITRRPTGRPQREPVGKLPPGDESRQPKPADRFCTCTRTTFAPVGSERFQEPWYVMNASPAVVSPETWRRVERKARAAPSAPERQRGRLKRPSSPLRILGVGFAREVALRPAYHFPSFKMFKCSGGVSSPRLSRSLLFAHSSPLTGLKARPTNSGDPWRRCGTRAVEIVARTAALGAHRRTRCTTSQLRRTSSCPDRRRPYGWCGHRSQPRH